MAAKPEAKTYDIHNPTQARRVIYSGINKTEERTNKATGEIIEHATQHEINIPPGETVRHEVADHVVANIQKRTRDPKQELQFVVVNDSKPAPQKQPAA